jgi:hypothetical protein
MAAVFLHTTGVSNAIILDPCTGSDLYNTDTIFLAITTHNVGTAILIMKTVFPANSLHSSVT